MRNPTNESLHVAVVDIGKLKNIGWVVEGPFVNESGTDIDACIEALASAMKTGPLALGFEVPMFVPFGRPRFDLDKARKGDGDRAFSASAGAAVLTKGLVIVAYILEGLRCRTRSVRPTFQWRSRLSAHDLLLFEAFVSHLGESVGHVECARLAVDRFPKERHQRASFKSAVEEPCTMNLLGAMLLRVGWTDDLAMLSEPCLVVRYQGELH
jgi:hypothetical protein